ncbi:hypothetical protein [Stenotrophomonas maltophilia]|uniref:hypothetical protein n=1 Tax=Stenotrophomonas maltophilia TaxID=40324 RepID=UPI0013D8FDC3|nr:hypothetical protein [Stenotrophomonas maltophilia]
MDAIEKRARELLAAEWNAGGWPDIANRVAFEYKLAESPSLRAIIAALMLGRPVDLLDQDTACRAQSEELKVVLPPALGADEAGSVGVDQVAGGLPRDIQLAEVALEEVASEHWAGVRLEGDGEVAADHIADERKLVERVAMALQASEQAQTGWTWADCSPIEVEGWMDLARAAIAALTSPKGYVLVPVAQLRHLLSDAITSVEFIAGRGQSKPLSRRVSDQAWALVELIPARRMVP